MSLFIRHPPKKSNKRLKQTQLNGSNRSNRKKRKTNVIDIKTKSDVSKDEENISSESDLSVASENESDVVEETAQEKRIRVAKKYLEEIEKEEAEKAETGDPDKDIISHRLRRDVLQQAGKLRQKVADQYTANNVEILHTMKGHNLPVTCLALTSDERFAFSGSKDCSIIKWCLQTGKRLKVIPGGRKGTEDVHVGHTGHVLCLAISTDDKYLASGCRNKQIHIWNIETVAKLHTFKGHKDAISGLAFQKGTHQLFSSSLDRSVKIWNLDEMAYVETLFGHQDAITGIDAFMQERALTSGGRDNTLRLWKVVEESQLVFQGSGSSIDNCCLINDHQFVSGSDDGSLTVWGIQKKKPLNVIPKAHGINETSREPYWIISVTSLFNTDLIATGSQDGKIRLWQMQEKNLVPLFDVPLVGFINDIKFSSSGNYLIAAVGQEHRLGRWWKLKSVKNVVTVIRLKR